jgi:cytochrome P450
MEARRLPRPGARDQVRLLRTLFRDPQPALDELRQRHGPVCGLGFGPARMAVVGGGVALRELLAAPTESFRWGHKFNALGFVVGPGSMIVSDGPDHARRRGAVQGAFTRKRLNGWIPTIVEQTDVAVDRLLAEAPTGPVDLYRVGRALILEIVVQSLFGPRLAPRAAELGELFQRPQDYLESPAVRQLPHPIPWTRRARARADRQAIDAIIDAELAHCRSHPAEDPSDVLAALVADGTLTDREIRDQVVTLVGAGYDTTASSLAWMLWRATLAPGLWARLGEEADAVLGPPGATATVDHSHLARLDLADRTMRETLRLHPAGALSPREAAVDVTVGGFRIPKGTLILWSAHLAGRDAEVWDDPLRFDPDRFADLDDARRRLADVAWVPFGRGPRNCLGFALAQIELTLVLARLAQRLEVSPPTAELPRPVGMVVNRPTGGAPMLATERAAPGQRAAS